MRNVVLRSLLMGALLSAPIACGQPDDDEKSGDGWTTSEVEADEDEEEEEPDEPQDEEDEEPEDEEEEPEEEEPEPQGTLPDGSGCADDSECLGGTCLVGPAWPGGYCTTSGCDGSCETPDSGCVSAGNDAFCAAYCANDDECRDGYACAAAPGAPGRVCVAPTGAPDGSPCEADGDCQGGTCITDWPGGFCTTFGCEDFQDCSRQGHENKCLRVRGPDLCVRICTSNDDCRDGYLCEMFGNGEGMCSPDPATPLDPAVLAGNPFDISCQMAEGGSVDIDYTIAPDTVAYMVTPLTPDGARLQPRTIELPDGASVDFGGANWFQTIPAELYGGMNPTVVPATEEYVSHLQEGVNTYTLRTEAAEVCHYVLEESAFGDTIDLNIHFVGVPGLDASSAPNHADLQEVLEQFDEIYAAAGVSIGKIRYYDITGTDADRYAVLRSEADLASLVALTERPGPTMDDALSTNIFFVRSLAMGGAIGISSGLPGPAGLHGTHGSGVAFTSEYMGGTADPSLGDQGVDGNVFTGQVLAHEVGHYLGLFHTSEQGGFSFDPLPDTPQCQRISNNCPDITNLMFPFAGAANVEITPDQGYVVGVSPLTKVADTGGTP